MRRKIITIVIVATLLASLAVVPWRMRPSPASADGHGLDPLSHTGGLGVPDSGPPVPPIADPSAYAELNSDKTTALQDVRIIEGIIQNYRQLLNAAEAPPFGFNEEVTRALIGGNPLGLAFIPSSHFAINAHGLLCDRWGTPYHFHPLSHDRMDVRSAGPDQKLFTEDDVVSASSPAVSGPVQPLEM